VKRLKNAGYDHTSAKWLTGRLRQRLARFDEFAQEMARAYPVLGLGDPDDLSADFAGRLWEILDEDRAIVTPMDDPDLLREAAHMVLAQRQAAEQLPTDATWEEFRRRSEVERYRRWLAERYTKPAKGQRSFDWDESDHPRKADGTFAPKGGGNDGEAVDTTAPPTPEEQAKYDGYVRLMGQFKLKPATLEDWLDNYRRVQARIRREQEAEQAASQPEEAASSEPAPEDQTLDLAPDATPREAAGKVLEKQTDSEYAFARQSAIPNAGEDVLGSARHKANAWRGLEEAERDGTAEELVTRDKLLKNEPHALVIHASRNPLTALTMYYALRAFPGKPGYGTRQPTPEEAKKNRAQYLNAYRRIKAKAEDLAAHQEDPVDASRELGRFVSGLIREYRGQTGASYHAQLAATDKYNATANALVPLNRRLIQTSLKTSIPRQTEEFVKAFTEKYGQDLAPEEKHDRLADHVADILDGASLNKTLGRQSTTPSQFNPAELYVKVAKREGGRVLPFHSGREAVEYMTAKQKFRGIQFGNSVTDEEREHHARKCAEAMADLADVLGLPDEYVSWKGRLAIAFGARGKGNAVAHYEPDRQVINLTRKSGVGSLAHEWGHFLDHMLAGGVGAHDDDRDVEYFSEQISPQRVVTDNRDGRKTIRLVDQSQDPMWQAFKRLRESWESSGFRARIRREAAGMARRDYWFSNIEMFARTFERYVQRRLESVGHKNTYLAGIETKAYKEDGLWPTDEEVDAMTPAFDALFQELADGIEKGRYWLREVGERLVLERRSPLAEQFAKAFAARGFVVRYAKDAWKDEPRDEDGRGTKGGANEEGPQHPFDEAAEAEPHRQKALAKIQATLQAASYLSPDKQAAYGKAAHQILHAMGAKALARWNANVRKIFFYASSETVDRLARYADPTIPPGRIVGTFVARRPPDNPVCDLYLNGGQELQDRFPKTTADNYAHEFAHAIDRDPVTGKPMSARSDWVEAWKAEVQKLGAMIDPNARVYPHEGFAEFGRIAWNYPEFARRHCPQCWKLWSQEGLV